MKSQIKFWMLITVITAFLALYFLFVFIPMKKKIDRAQTGIAQTEQEINTSILRIRQIPDMRARRDEFKRAVDELGKRLLVPDSISSAMNQLNRLCALYQVKLNSMNFSTDSLLAKSRASGSASNASFELPILMELEGRYLDIGLTVEHLHRLPFVISFTDFNITSQNKTDKLKIEARACVRIAASGNLQTVKR